MTATFRPFRRAVEGHLLQVGAGYLTDPQFVHVYRMDPYKYHYPDTYHCNDPVWLYYGQSCYQIKYDSEYIFGLLMSACREVGNKSIMMHEKDKNGILAWFDLRKDHDNDGSRTLRMESLSRATNILATML